MSALWVTLMVRMRRVVSTNRPMEECIGRGFSIRDPISRFQIWRCVLLPRSSCLPALGVRIALPGAHMLRSTELDPAAGFIVRRMPAKPGLVLTEAGFPRAIGEGLASTLRLTAGACMRL